MPVVDYVQLLEAKIQVLRANGLSDIKFDAGEVSRSTVQSFAREACEWCDAIEAGRFTPLRFNDSQRLQ